MVKSLLSICLIQQCKPISVLSDYDDYLSPSLIMMTISRLLNMTLVILVVVTKIMIN
jgi:hypothetical protein